MEVIEQKLITSLSDLGHLNIIDFNRLNGLYSNNSVTAMQTIGNWLIGNVMYTIIRQDMRTYPDRGDFPKWVHTGNGSHQRLGKLYWNMFHAHFDGTLEFHDSPDFSGTLAFDDMKKVRLCGDIGKVSASTFGVDVMPGMNTHDVWISVVDVETHIFLEFLADVGIAIHEYISDSLGLPALAQKVTAPKQGPVKTIPIQASLW